MYFPITRMDAGERIVYGVVTAEQPDRAGEVCDYATTKARYQAWSRSISDMTGGKSLGNVRAMHGSEVAAGKVVALDFDDAGKTIRVGIKVVDEGEWFKCEAGVYTGLSHGGNYLKRWPGADGVTRYTADPKEISLVDRPSLPSATFEMIRADGSAEMRKFMGADAKAPAVPVGHPNAELIKIADELLAISIDFNATVVRFLSKSGANRSIVEASVARIDGLTKSRAGLLRGPHPRLSTITFH